MPAATFIDIEREKEFDRTGYTTIRLFEPEEAETIRQRFVQLTANEIGANHSVIYLSFLESDAAKKDRLTAAATELLSEALAPHLHGGRVQNGGVVIKNPGDGRLAVHNHTPITDACFGREIVCWCPLADVDEGFGALRVIPRSHHLLPFIRLPGATGYTAHFQGKLENYAKSVPCRAGEAILFDNTLLHGSEPNRGATPRYAVSAQIVPDEAANGIYLDGGDGFLDFIEVPPAEAFQEFLRSGVRPAEWRVAKRVRNTNRAITEAEFRHLLGLEPAPGPGVGRPDQPRAGVALLRKLSDRLRRWIRG